MGKKKDNYNALNPDTASGGFNIALIVIASAALAYSVVAGSFGIDAYRTVLNYEEISNKLEDVNILASKLQTLTEEIELALGPFKQESREYVPLPSGPPFSTEQHTEVNGIWMGASYNIFRNVNAAGFAFTTGEDDPLNGTVLYFKFMQGTAGTSADSNGNITTVAKGTLANVNDSVTTYYAEFDDGPVVFTAGLLHLVFTATNGSGFSMISYYATENVLLNVDVYPHTTRTTYLTTKALNDEFDSLDPSTDMIYAGSLSPIAFPTIRLIGPDLPLPDS